MISVIIALTSVSAFAFCDSLAHAGITTAARIAITPTTTISSISVNPFWPCSFMSHWFGRFRPNLRHELLNGAADRVAVTAGSAGLVIVVRAATRVAHELANFLDGFGVAGAARDVPHGLILVGRLGAVVVI